MAFFATDALAIGDGIYGVSVVDDLAAHRCLAPAEASMVARFGNPAFVISAARRPSRASQARSQEPMNARAKNAKCPICGKPREDRFRPFCSRRCADVDLHRWLGGAYAIPAAEQDDTEDEQAPPRDEESN
jgi:uncharacterized protein